jgi:hypothetical protein
VQPVPPRQAERQLRDVHWLPSWQAKEHVRGVQNGTRRCAEFEAGYARAKEFARDQARAGNQARARAQTTTLHHPRLLRHRRRGLLVPERKSSRCCTLRRVGRERRDTFFERRVLQITHQERVLNTTNTNYPSSPNSFVNLSCTSRSALATVGRAFNKTFWQKEKCQSRTGKQCQSRTGKQCQSRTSKQRAACFGKRDTHEPSGSRSR